MTTGEWSALHVPELARVDVVAWAKAMAPAAAADAAAALHSRCQHGDLHGTTLFSARDTAGALVGGWGLVPQGGAEVSVGWVFGGVGDAPRFLATIERIARENRLVVVLRWSAKQIEPLKKHLPDRGWRSMGERVEWVHPVGALPEAQGTVLSWRRADRLPRDQVVQLLAGVTQGDPIRPMLLGTPADWLAGWEQTPGLNGHFWVGHTTGAAIALLGAQVDPQTGWCRLPYWGVHPRGRGQGLGQHVLCKGFALLRVMGGRMLHGGCMANNTAVLRHIRRAGIVPRDHVQEWCWSDGMP